MAFLVVVGLIGASTPLFFHLNRNAALKRKMWPVVVVLGGTLTIGFAYYLMGVQQQVLYFTVPVVTLVCFLNIRGTRFCDSCGRTLYRQPMAPQFRICPHCGAQVR